MVDLATQEQRIADRLEELIAEGRRVAGLDRPYDDPMSTQSSIRGRDREALQSWLARAGSLIERIFKRDSSYFHQYQELTENYISVAQDVFQIVGLLEGARDDLIHGYLIDQELLIAGEVFDSLLDQARHLQERGYKDPAAALVRVVLEDGLRRISRQEGLDTTLSVGDLNNNLREAGRYPKPQWRRIQSWLDIGHAAAHGNFDEYEHAQVADLIEEVEGFLARELA